MPRIPGAGNGFVAAQRLCEESISLDALVLIYPDANNPFSPERLSNFTMIRSA